MKRFPTVDTNVQSIVNVDVSVMSFPGMEKSS